MCKGARVNVPCLLKAKAGHGQALKAASRNVGQIGREGRPVQSGRGRTPQATAPSSRHYQALLNCFHDRLSQITSNGRNICRAERSGD